MGSPLIDYAKSLEQKFESALGKVPTPGYKSRQKKYEADPGMVKEATDSFVKKDEDDKKAAAKKAPQKRMPRKR